VIFGVRSIGISPLYFSMPNILAFDVGLRRTGTAIAFSATDMAVAKDTIHHKDMAALEAQIRSLCDQYEVTTIILGLPLLPSGDEGPQVKIVKLLAKNLEKLGFEVLFIDERYTTARNVQYDGDAASACQILSMFIERKNNLTQS
jgi:putative Holliday junction resolvase